MSYVATIFSLARSGPCAVSVGKTEPVETKGTTAIGVNPETGQPVESSLMQRGKRHHSRGGVLFPVRWAQPRSRSAMIPALLLPFLVKRSFRRLNCVLTKKDSKKARNAYTRGVRLKDHRVWKRPLAVR